MTTITPNIVSARGLSRTTECDIFSAPMAAKACTHYRDHRAGRLVPRGTAPRQGLRSLRSDPAAVGRQLLANRPPARSADAASGRPAGPAVADPRDRKGAAPGGLQPGGDVVRAGVVGPADADRRVQFAGRDARARSHSRRRPVHPPLPGVVVRDVRQGARSAAARNHAVLSAESVRRVQSVRALHHGELSRELQPVRRVGHSVQSRIAAARARVRDAQGHRRRRAHQARQGEGAAARQPRPRTATGDSPATTCARCG